MDAYGHRFRWVTWAAGMTIVFAGCTGGAVTPSQSAISTAQPGAQTTAQTTAQTSVASCEIPLEGPAAAAQCEGTVDVLDKSDGPKGPVYKLAIPLEDPSTIMATLTRAALDHRGEGDEVTFVAYGDAQEAKGSAYTRGRLTVRRDGGADYEVCTAFNGNTGSSTCADHITFTVDIFD